MFIKYLLFFCVLSSFTTSLMAKIVSKGPPYGSYSVLTGNFIPHKSIYFREIPRIYAAKRSLFMRKEALRSFIRMARAAKKDGISLYIVSATRTYSQQQELWNKKYATLTSSLKNNEKQEPTIDGADIAIEPPLDNGVDNTRKEPIFNILKFSAAPGTSRHHWGTDIDITYSLKHQALENKDYEQGSGLKAYRWLRRKASFYGFCQPYLLSPEQRNQGKYNNGYEEEKWHWSYRPLSRTILASYTAQILSFPFSNFDGADRVASVYVDYVKNIHRECR